MIINKKKQYSNINRKNKLLMINNKVNLYNKDWMEKNKRKKNKKLFN